MGMSWETLIPQDTLEAAIIVRGGAGMTSMQEIASNFVWSRYSHESKNKNVLP